jgi:hypothetical protein
VPADAGGYTVGVRLAEFLHGDVGRAARHPDDLGQVTQTAGRPMGSPSTRASRPSPLTREQTITERSVFGKHRPQPRPTHPAAAQWRPRRVLLQEATGSSERVRRPRSIPSPRRPRADGISINAVQGDRHVRRWRVLPGGGAVVGAVVGEVAQRGELRFDPVQPGAVGRQEDQPASLSAAQVRTSVCLCGEKPSSTRTSFSPGQRGRGL